MTHDPMCSWSSANDETELDFCDCDLIARVREDERGKAAARLSQHWQETVGRGEPTVAEDELAAVLGTESPTVLHRRVGGCIPHYDSGYAAALRDAQDAVLSTRMLNVVDGQIAADAIGRLGRDDA